MSTTDKNWYPSSDVYEILKMINETKARYINDQDEETLSIGIFGVLGDISAKKIQMASQQTYILGNEMFPSRARLTKNLITHAAYHNIENINAVPASVVINLAIKVDDIDKYATVVAESTGTEQFVFDKTCPIFIGNYELHLDYDIILTRSWHNRYDNQGNKVYTYNARYNMDPNDLNPISDLTNAYLLQPFVVNFNNTRYVFLQPTVRQCSIEISSDTILTNTIIENKSYTFNFSNQLADFVVYVTENGVTKRLTPYMYGSIVEPDAENYCWYLYTADDTIRIQFDRTNYIPGFNSDIRVVAYTTVGSEGNFSYQNTEDETGFYVDFESSIYNYKKITCIVNCATDSEHGSDRKSKEDLQSLLPKMALSRGYITTEQDLINYFNLISDSKHKLHPQKKVDNQLRRIWYTYTVLKDSMNNIIPTNSIHLNIDIKDTSYVTKVDDTRYIIPAGTTFVLDKNAGIGEHIDPNQIPEYFTDAYFNDTRFYYSLIHNMIINTDPLYCSYFSAQVNLDDYLSYQYANEKVNLGFVANKMHVARNLLSDNKVYYITLDILQSTMDDYGLIISEKDQTTGEVTIIKNNMKVFMLLYKDSQPYRWVEAKLSGWDQETYKTSWTVELETDNKFTVDNELNLLSLGVPNSTGVNDGLFKESIDADVFILARFTEEDDPVGGYGKSQCTDYIPASVIDEDGENKFTLVNTYKTNNGITLFENYTDVMNTKIKAISTEDGEFDHYYIRSVPMVGCHYLTSESHAIYLAKALSEQKSYIDYCTSVLEDNMQIDFKTYNTYGPSLCYAAGSTTTITDAKDLDHVDTSWQFRMKLANSNDTYTKTDVIRYIKDYIENLNNTGADLHIPNLLHDIKEEFKGLIIYIEFKNFNGNEWGVNHLLLKEVTDPNLVPELINVRNRLLSDGETLEPCIDIELDRT